MTSSEQLDDPASMSSLLELNAKKARDSLSPNEPQLEKCIKLAQVWANGLKEFFRFLYEDSESEDPKRVRDYMIEEMVELRRIRGWLIKELEGYFTDPQVIEALSRVKNRSEVINSCIDELNSIRTEVKQTLGDAVEATLDDLSNEQLWPLQQEGSVVLLSLSAQRRDRRRVALESLQTLAQRWGTLSEQLSSATAIADQEGSA